MLGVFDSIDEMDDGDDDDDDGDGEDNLRDDGGWFCSEGQALPAMVESLDVFAGHLTTKVRLALFVVFFSIGLIFASEKSTFCCSRNRVLWTHYGS